MRRAALAFALVLAAAGSAQAGLEGEWCGSVETLIIKPTGVGFNEHTSCAFEGPVILGPALSARLICKNVYGGDTGVDLAAPVPDPIDLTIVTLRPGLIAAHWGGARGDLLTRCD